MLILDLPPEVEALRAAAAASQDLAVRIARERAAARAREWAALAAATRAALLTELGEGVGSWVADQIAPREPPPTFSAEALEVRLWLHVRGSRPVGLLMSRTSGVWKRDSVVAAPSSVTCPASGRRLPALWKVGDTGWERAATFGEALALAQREAPCS